MRASVALAVVLVGGCNAIFDIPEPSELDAGPVVDAQPAGRCDHTDRFGAPVRVQGLATRQVENAVWLLDDERTALLTRAPDLSVPKDLYVATRTDVSSPFQVPESPEAISSAELNEHRGTMSRDGLTLWLDRPETKDGAAKLHRATRGSLQEAFGMPSVVPEIASERGDDAPAPGPDGIYFSSRRHGAFARLYIAPYHEGGFDTPKRIPASFAGTGYVDEVPVPSADGLALYFGRNFDSVLKQIYVSRRTSMDEEFQTAEPVTTLQHLEDPDDTTGDPRRMSWPTWLSDDNCRLYFMSTRDGGNQDIWVAARTPVQ